MERNKKIMAMEIDSCFSDGVQGYLVELRERCHMSLTCAAQWQDMDKGNLCKYETSRSDMYTSTFLRIVNRYRECLCEPSIPLDYFMVHLKQFRVEKGYSVRGLADLLNVDTSVVSVLEKSENMMLKTYIRSCLVLGVEILSIF